MITQMFWIVLAIFVLGLFIGSNLGVMLMCVLAVGAKDTVTNEELVTVSANVES